MRVCSEWRRRGEERRGEEKGGQGRRGEERRGEEGRRAGERRGEGRAGEGRRRRRRRRRWSIGVTFSLSLIFLSLAADESSSHLGESKETRQQRHMRRVIT
eukprot:768281-Hanusia_phi.AAC.11